MRLAECAIPSCMHVPYFCLFAQHVAECMHLNLSTGCIRGPARLWLNLPLSAACCQLIVSDGPFLDNGCNAESEHKKVHVCTVCHPCSVPH